MIAIPAIDLRDGACVQLVGGDYERERVRLEDPVAVAQRWRQLGFTRLHVVDLDAATGRGDNIATIGDVIQAFGSDVQVGGGVRDDVRLKRLFDLGATRAVIGTSAFTSPPWLREVAQRWQRRLIVAADVRDGILLTSGWQHSTGLEIGRVVRDLDSIPLAGLLVTAVHVEGTMAGPDLPLLRRVSSASQHDIIASGGVGSLNDVRAAAGAGAAAVVIGMALYTGAIEPCALARQFA